MTTQDPPRPPTADSIVDAWIANPGRAATYDLADTVAETQAWPLLARSMIAVAIVGANGAHLWCDAHFADWAPADAIDPAIVATTRSSGAPRSTAASDINGQPLVLVYLPARDGEAYVEGRRVEAGQVVVVAISLAHDGDILLSAARAHGMTEREARVAAALVRHGTLPRAAGACGMSYASARDAIAACLRKAGAARQSELVSLLTQQAGYLPADRDGAARALRDIFGLSAREAELALLLSEGHTRSEAAAAAGLSESVAKDVFERVFIALGVSSAPQVSRVAAEAFAASLLPQAPANIVWSDAVHGEPLRLISRVDGGRIALSDFGPPSGNPVLIVHSSATTRHPARSLVRALQAAGYRPLAIDRPGFGLSDMREDDPDPFRTAAHDMKRLCDLLDLPRIDIVARGGAHAALAFAHLYPEACGRVIALNPDTVIDAQSKREGVLGAAKHAVWRRPHFIEKFARIISAQATPKRVTQLMRASMRSSPPDLAVFEDERELADYHRAVMLFATGRLSGFIAEQRAYADGIDAPALVDASNWTVLLGAHDPLHHVDDMLGYWRPRLPGARFETIAEAGRFVHLSHPHAVLAALK
ncbi:alpha/beta fold hydrolase [Vitreimonas flagellata]|uniref:alpha/beta fold hydrolase n=1 Tax=Vitreimonas flagellata TaxID=2560861 RepID=UPI0010752F0F|nr:alpha/beta fold hydrolase [Vitreimonas flagellata]